MRRLYQALHQPPRGPGIDNRAALRASITPFAVGKVLTIAVVMLAAWQHGAGTGIPGWQALRGVFANWDGQSYLQIATFGYPPNSDPTPGAAAHVWAFMPGYPLLLRAVATVLRDQILSGIVVSAVCELLALMFTARLVSAERDERAARIAVWLLALLPYGVFLSLVYTESTFLVCAAASLYYMRQQRFLAAAVWGGLGTAVRVTGLALLFAFGNELAAVRGRRLLEGLYAVLIPLPFILFCVYAGVHAHDVRAFFHIESSASFHRQLTNPWTGFWATWHTVTSSGFQQSGTYLFMVEMVCGLAGLLGCLLLLAWRWVGARWHGGGMPLSFAVYAIVVWVLAVAQPYWLSVGRYEIAMLPLLIVAADVLRGNAQRTVAVVTASGGLMAYIATLWGQGNFIG